MKKIGVEVIRLYAMEVEDFVDPNDWRAIGRMMMVPPVDPEFVEVLAWHLPDGDLDGPVSAVNEEVARQRRSRDGIELLARENIYSS